MKINLNSLILICLQLIIIKLNIITGIAQCDYEIIETIPMEMNYPNETIKTNSTFTGIMRILESATRSLDIAAFYFTLLCKDVLPEPDISCEQGEQIMRKLTEISLKNVVQVRLAIDKDSNLSSKKDLLMLAKAGVKIRFLEFKRLVGAGVLHTKFIIADQHSAYIGSSNFDWRSYTQVKELGILLHNCSTNDALSCNSYDNSNTSLLINDLRKIFSVYWLIGKANIIPAEWPDQVKTEINLLNKLSMKLNQQLYNVFISSSPFQLNPAKRTNDIDAILSIINATEYYVDISVMNYSPVTKYSKRKLFWPILDNSLRAAFIERGVHVRLLIGYSKHTSLNMLRFLSSLNAFREYEGKGRIEVRLLQVPALSNHTEIPFSRIAHTKYMITERYVYIGTSNWTPDYFLYTGGVGFIAECAEIGGGGNSKHACSLHRDLHSVFNRDWFSNYSIKLETLVNATKPKNRDDDDDELNKYC